MKKLKSLLKGKILHKPKVDIIERKDLLKQLKKSNNYSMVKPEEPQEEIVQDDRSLFFNKEFSKEKKKFLS
jgi:hypothetical protein